MLRRRKNSQNIWFLLAVPVVGAVGWAMSRLLRSRKSDTRDAMRYRRAAEQAAKDQPRETGLKESDKESKFLPTAAQRGDISLPAAEKQEVSFKQSSPTGHAIKNQPEKLTTFFLLLIPFLILPVAIVMLAFNHLPVQSPVVVPGGDPERGKAALQTWGCGSCHTIEGVPGANSTIGPTLNNESDRSYIGGHLRNTPDNMVQWITHPQEVSPGVDMPDSGVPDGVARDMAAYLYSIR